MNKMSYKNLNLLNNIKISLEDSFLWENNLKKDSKIHSDFDWEDNEKNTILNIYLVSLLF